MIQTSGLWLRRVFLAARAARFYGVGDVQLPALQHGQERVTQRKGRCFQELRAEPGHRVAVEAAEVVEAQHVLYRLDELVSELAAEFGEDALVVALDVIQDGLRIRQWGARTVAPAMKNEVM